LDDGVSNDEDCNQDLVDEVGIIDIGGLTAMDDNNCFDNVNVSKGSSAPMDRALVCLHKTMVNVTTKCVAGVNVELSNHATSFFEELDRTIITFIWLESTNPCTWEWYFARWMMV
jgi:hypothetical protein